MSEFDANEYKADLALQHQSYVDQLKQAKIVTFCSSIKKLAMKKYVEASLAGALVVADIPAERQTEFKKYVVELEMDMNSTTVNNIFVNWLNRTKERIEKATVGQRINTNYSTENFMDTLVRYWKMYREGRRGLLLPYAFELTKPWCIPPDPKYNADCGFVGYDPIKILESRKPVS